MSNDEEILKATETILNDAHNDIVKQRRAEHIAAVPLLGKAFMKQVNESDGKDKNIHCGFIVPDETFQKDATPITEDIGRRALENPDEFRTASLRLFHSFANIADATTCFGEPSIQMVVCEQFPMDTGFFLIYNKPADKLYAMVAANCLTVMVVRGKETIVEHTQLEDGKADVFFKALSLRPKQERLVRSATEFHMMPREIKQQYPESYAVMLKSLMERFSDEGDDK